MSNESNMQPVNKLMLENNEDETEDFTKLHPTDQPMNIRV